MRNSFQVIRPRACLQGGIQNELFKASYEEVQALEDEVGILKQEEAQRLVIIRDVETQRNRIARVAADTQRKVRLTEDDVAFKHVIVQDLKRTRKEVVRRYNDFQQLYQLVKNQRNKFVSLVAVAGQGIGEFKEKVKILTNEMEVRDTIHLAKCIASIHIHHMHHLNLWVCSHMELHMTYSQTNRANLLHLSHYGHCKHAR